MLKTFASLLAAALLLSGCVTTTPRQPYDYTAFRQSHPVTLLVLPPINRSPDIKASNSVLSFTTKPLAESGYYVIPVGVMAETFRQNGLNTPEDVHNVSPAKLREIFAADAALYIEISEYGTRFQVLNSETRVSANAKLIDLRDGQTLWRGSASASTGENRNNSNQNSFAALLVTAIVNQVIETSTDQAHPTAGVMTGRLLYAGRERGVLYGPRSPHYGKEQPDGQLATSTATPATTAGTP